ncbi:uncharacterized protein V1510DRAFT_412572 [Dipodascopsis tothii]|uniref:uncharacterized protein n=1 Tax=Dipodascopsis tothii TaxID=44089 RepID=UPI0034CF5103
MAYPELKNAFHMYLKAQNSDPVYTNEAGPPGTRIFVQIVGGYLESTNEALPFEAKILTGTNWLFKTPENHLTLDVRMRCETDDGHGLYVHYTGYTYPTEAMNAVFAGTGTTMEFGSTEFFIGPILETDSPKYAWVNNKKFVGRGRFVRDAEGFMGAEYYVSLVA